MTYQTKILSKCADIHRVLWRKASKEGEGNPNLGLGEAYGDDPRDAPLLTALAAKLGIPNQKFIESEEAEHISAQTYLIALLEVMEPLAFMFKEIWDFCARAAIGSSKHSKELAWDFTYDGETIDIDLQHFRKYQGLQRPYPEPQAFGTLSNAFANALRLR